VFGLRARRTGPALLRGRDTEDEANEATLRITAAAATFLASTAFGATPAERCERGKNTEAGGYVECRQRAEAKYALRGDAAARASALAECADRFGTKWTQLESRAGGTCPSTGDQSAIQQALDTASTDVAAALAGPLAAQAKPVKTGQTGCWNGSGQPIPCAGTGQDGEFQNGADRVLVDNGDGTITDVRTGLMWEKLSDDGSIHDTDNDYSWGDAYAYKVAGLNAIAFAGYTDWRLPNVNELQSLLNYGVAAYPAVSPAFQAGCVPGCSVLTCSCSWRVGYTHGIFWTSSTYQSAPYYLWTVAVYDGSIGYEARNEVRHARAVRGGS
jgi:hypothetical protein